MRVDPSFTVRALVVLAAVGAAGVLLNVLTAWRRPETPSMDGYSVWIALAAVVVAIAIAVIVVLMLKMRHLSAALDKEVLSLSDAAALTDKTGESVVLTAFRSSEPTFRDVLGISAALLLKLDAEKGVLVPLADYGLAGRWQRRTLRVHGQLTALLATLDPIVIEDLTHHPIGSLAPRAEAAELHGQLLPLVANGQTMGCLCLLKARGDAFRAEDIDLLRAVSSELGTSWHNASLYERLSRSAPHPLAAIAYRSEERRIETLRTLTEAVLSEKSLMGSVMDSIADGVILTDVMGNIRMLNPKASEILGHYANDAVGRNVVEFVQQFEPVTVEVMRAQFRKIVEQGETVTTEIKLSLPSTRHYKLSLAPVRSADGFGHGIVAVLSDITQLKELDQMKTDLMSMVTHEIRTPLATVRGFARILLKGDASDEKSAEFLEIIHRQSNRLVNLVNDFLDITRIESGRQAISRGPVDLDRLVHNALSDLKPLADEKAIELRYEPTGKLPEIYADRNLIEQVLINLLSNAVKYSPRGAWAEVVVRRGSDVLEVSIQDNGLGIPQQCLPRLFEKFYRVRSDDRTDIIGTGLGLSLVKQIIDIHGGGISVTSEHGKGSNFTFTVPTFQGDAGTSAVSAADPNAVTVH